VSQSHPAKLDKNVRPSYKNCAWSVEITFLRSLG
jgi:hypothetical protein